MKRLTRTDWKTMNPMECCGQKDYCIRRREVENACLNCIVPKLYVRVAAFEDAGVPMQKTIWMKEIIEEAFDNDTSRIERAHELHVADKEGRVVVLPCKVGDTVYFVNAKQILEFTVVGYAVDETGISWVYSEYVDKTGHTHERTFLPEKIGETTFLTREEAERAMEGRKDG